MLTPLPRSLQALLPAIFLILCSHGPVAAGTIHVPGEYSTIAAAADAAVIGDTVLVAHPPPPASFYEDEHIVIRPGVSIIGAVQDSPLVSIALVTISESHIEFAAPPGTPLRSTEPARLEWFTIAGHGLLIWSSNPACEVRYNKIRPVDASSFGMIAEHGGLIERNKLHGYGSLPNGLLVLDGYALVRFNIFQYMAPGFWVDNDAAPATANVDFRNNTLQVADVRLDLLTDSTVDIVNNLYLEDAGIAGTCTPGVAIRHNDFAFGLNVHPSCSLGAGNLIDVDPEFCESPPWIDYFYPQPGSPLLDGGEGGALIGAFWIGCGTTAVPATPRSVSAPHALIAPNPARDHALITVASHLLPVEIDIYDPVGRFVDRTTLEHSTSWRWTVDRTRPAGLYVVRLRSADITMTRKLVVTE